MPRPLIIAGPSYGQQLPPAANTQRQQSPPAISLHLGYDTVRRVKKTLTKQKMSIIDLDEDMRPGLESELAYPEICEPKPCRTDRAVRAAATKKANKGKQIAMANSAEHQLLLINGSIVSASDQALSHGVLMNACIWHLATGTKFSNGYCMYWPGVWPGGLP